MRNISFHLLSSRHRASRYARRTVNSNYTHLSAIPLAVYCSHPRSLPLVQYGAPGTRSPATASQITYRAFESRSLVQTLCASSSCASPSHTCLSCTVFPRSHATFLSVYKFGCARCLPLQLPLFFISWKNRPLVGCLLRQAC